MEGWQHRVVEEARQLSNRLANLTTYLDSGALSALSGEVVLLLRQKGCMQAYLTVLKERIAKF